MDAVCSNQVGIPDGQCVSHACRNRTDLPNPRAGTGFAGAAPPVFAGTATPAIAAFETVVSEQFASEEPLFRHGFCHRQGARQLPIGMHRERSFVECFSSYCSYLRRKEMVLFITIFLGDVPCLTLSHHLICIQVALERTAKVACVGLVFVAHDRLDDRRDQN